MIALQANVLRMDPEVWTMTRVAGEATVAGAANPVHAAEQAPAAGALVTELPLRCVWSDAGDGCSCRTHVPHAIVREAWFRECEASGEEEGRFFHFIHDGGVWLAYGREGGQVGGVYCPGHNSQRAERSRAALSCYGDDVIELPLAA